MNGTLKVGKGLLKLAFNLVKITLMIIDAFLIASKETKNTPRYNRFEAIDLFYKGEISAQDYQEATDP